jgi:hypothetical protein
VKGVRGIYFWTKDGPAVFDGVAVRDLGLNLELDLGARASAVISGGVHVWRDSYTKTIRFYRWNLETPVLQYIFWEESGHWTTLDEDAMYLAGNTYVSADIYGVATAAITTNTDIAIEQNEEQGTRDLAGALFLTRATWRGIAFEEGMHVNKTIHQIRVLFDMILTGTSLKCSIVPDVEADTAPDANLVTRTPTPSRDIQWEVFIPLARLEAPVWRLDLHFPPGTKIYEVAIDYTVGGDTQGPIP